eukprot:462961-Amphidinium_carterae.2
MDGRNMRARLLAPSVSSKHIHILRAMPSSVTDGLRGQEVQRHDAPAEKPFHLEASSSGTRYSLNSRLFVSMMD